MVKIYILEKNGIPFYVGKAKDSTRRKNAHKKTFGLDIQSYVIDEVEDWKFWENYWIYTNTKQYTRIGTTGRCR